MTNNPDQWEMRRLPNGLALQLRRGGNPTLVLVQGNRQVVVDLAHVKAVVAGLTDAAAGLTELLDSDGRYHA